MKVKVTGMAYVYYNQTVEMSEKEFNDYLAIVSKDAFTEEDQLFINDLAADYLDLNKIEWSEDLQDGLIIKVKNGDM